jgi:hypothetical protein
MVHTKMKPAQIIEICDSLALGKCGERWRILVDVCKDLFCIPTLLALEQNLQA